MAIATGDAIWKFDTEDEISDSTSSVSNGDYSVAGDVDSTWANTTNVVVASAVLKATFGTNPDANSTISLFARLMNVEGSNDMPVIDDNFSGIYLGAFTSPDLVTAAQYLTLTEHPLPSVSASQIIEFYIKNDCGQTLSSGWELWVTPKTYGGAA